MASPSYIRREPRRSFWGQLMSLLMADGSPGTLATELPLLAASVPVQDPGSLPGTQLLVAPDSRACRRLSEVLANLPTATLCNSGLLCATWTLCNDGGLAAGLRGRILPERLCACAAPSGTSLGDAPDPRFHGDPRRGQRKGRLPLKGCPRKNLSSEIPEFTATQPEVGEGTEAPAGALPACPALSC